MVNGWQIRLSILREEVHIGIFAVPDHLFDDGTKQTSLFLQRGRIHRAGEGFDHLLMEGKLLMEHLSTLTEGDEVILTTLWGEDHYRVSGFAVIVPDDIASVMIQPGRELLTLLSCHPYASGGKYRFLAICEKEISEVVP